MRLDGFAVVVEGEACVEVGVVPESFADELFVESVLFEDCEVGDELYVGAVGFFSGALFFGLEDALSEAGFEALAVAEATDEEVGGEGVDCFETDSVETDGELEDIVVVFGAGVDLADAVEHFSEGDAPSVVADSEEFALWIVGDHHIIAVVHDEFVNAIINDFFKEDVDSVVDMGAIAEASDVHSGAQADMGESVECLDGTLIVLRLFCHIGLIAGMENRGKIFGVFKRRIGYAADDMHIGVLGMNHKSAPLAVREKFARLCQRHFSVDSPLTSTFDYVLLSTCNRTEIYFSALHLAEVHTALLECLRRGMACGCGEWCHQLYSYFGSECFLHLARVTAGLDSALVGETEIQGQVKEAYRAALVRALPSDLHCLFQKCLKMGKQVRRCRFAQEGWIAQEKRFVEVGEALLDIAPAAWRVLFVGFSEINRKMYRQLLRSGVRQVSFCNRSEQALEGLEVAVHPWKGRMEWRGYDLVVFGTRAPHFLATLEGVQVGSGRLLVLDFSVPRNVDPRIGQLPDVTLLNVDQLQRMLRTEQLPDLMEIERQLLAPQVAYYMGRLPLAAASLQRA